VGRVDWAVDGVPAREIGLNEARAMFCRSGKYRLEVRRAGREIETVVATRSLFGK